VDPKKVIKYGWRGEARRYKCKDCGKTFTDTTGTIFENSKIKPSKWLLIAYLHLKLGLTERAIARELGTPYKLFGKPWRKFSKLRSFFRDALKLDEDCEVDETYINAGMKGKTGEMARVGDEEAHIDGGEEHIRPTTYLYNCWS